VWCDDDVEPGGTGHPLLSMPKASMATAPQGLARPGKTLAPRHQPVQSPEKRSSASRNGGAPGVARARELARDAENSDPGRPRATDRHSGCTSEASLPTSDGARSAVTRSLRA
jgi:hypothetical protein